MSSKVVAVGLVGSGKSTFLAALWHVVCEGDVPGALRLTASGADQTRLNELTEKWLKGEELDRTFLDDEAFPVINVHPDQRPLESSEFVIPDLSGESFRRALSERAWSRELDSYVRASSGVLIFLHPDSVKPDATVAQGMELAAEIEPDSIATHQGGERIPWDYETASCQVKLVDLLQLLAGRMSNQPRVCLVISAWDLIADQDLTPGNWLDTHAPLLSQFLRHQRTAVRVFGVSAQGGRLPQDIDRLTSLDRPSERIKVIEGATQSHDITAPVRWLLSDEP